MDAHTKGLKKYTDELLPEDTQKKDIDQSNPNTDEERNFVTVAQNDISTAESIKNNNKYGVGGSYDLDTAIEPDLTRIWEDEYFIYKGGGLQWSTSFAKRKKRNRARRPNSEDNFIFNTLQTLNANMTTETPECSVQTVSPQRKEQEDDVGQKLTDIIKCNDDKLKFVKTFKRMVDDFNCYGPTIMLVEWDNDIVGGAGETRYIGDVRKRRIDKMEFFPDPAITDLEEDLQLGSYHVLRLRKKVDYVKTRWKDKARNISEEENEENLIDEGGDSKQTYLYVYYHRGFPKFMPNERVKELNDRADIEEEKGNIYKARDLRDAAKGSITGIHVAYICNGVLLEYIPYEYDHGMYPLVYTTKYTDEYSPWGWGEIRNLKIPQVMHNKADEIELEAMTRQGLGGKYYNESAVTPNQMKEIQRKDGKGAEWLAVKNVEQIKDRQPIVVPSNITNYKEHKQRMIQDIGSVNAIQQGISPGAGTPYRTVAELGSRADIRVSQATNKLADMLIEAYKLEIKLIEQFYTEERYYRVKGADGSIKEGTFRNDEMFLDWNRIDTDPNTGEQVENIEKFVPEYDVSVSVINEKPNDRSYNTSVAFDMYDRGLMSDTDLWQTLDDGTMPPSEVVIKNYKKQDIVKQMMGDIQQLPEEMQPQLMEQMAQVIEGMVQQVQGGEVEEPQGNIPPEVAGQELPPPSQPMGAELGMEGQEQLSPEMMGQVAGQGEELQEPIY